MAITLSQKVASYVGQLKRPSLFAFLAAILVLLILLQLARLFWAVVTPVGPVGNWQAKTPMAMSHQEQKTLFATVDPFFRQNPAQDSEERVTSLSLSLFGIRSTGESGAGSAIIADGEGEQFSYLVGEEIEQGVTLHSVSFDHVTISNNGALEKLYLDQSVPAETVSPESNTTEEASSSASDNTADVQINPQTFAAGITFAPRNEGGSITGLVVSAKDDGAMLRAAGFRQGDIVTKINGTPATSQGDVVAQIRPGARLSVEVERGGQLVPIAIILENP